ncbi:aspartate aminotransferase family protein [Rubrivirga sp.]|uniref:aspartate aminotransferase family protein n=1 Tax=Rubrivirga sp. TaxID=1885344 RepID=UPI003B525EFA
MDSDALYQRARELMPWGTQTNAKRPVEAFEGVMPLFFDRAEGCRLRTPEGRWFIDYRAALGPILLGYKHPEVDAAVREQLERGVLFSMASPVEVEVAERLVRAVPSLEQVRFMKTGNDANLSAVRLARGFTGRDHLVTCGYHGYGDWFACGTGAPASVVTSDVTGVPAALDALVTRVAYGDLEALERVFEARGHEIAAFITVPYDWGETVATAFVERARALTEQHGSLLIFDQVLTGFRLARGGAQDYFGVVPDLSTYAKALANGYPLSAYGGRRDVMETLYRLTITTTYAGETLSLAAAAATLDVVEREPVVEHVWAMGERLRDGFDRAARRHGLGARSIGLPPAVQVRFSRDPETEAQAQTVFQRELYRRGIFASRPFLLTYAHQPADIDETLEAVDAALEVVAGDAAISR